MNNVASSPFTSGDGSPVSLYVLSLLPRNALPVPCRTRAQFEDVFVGPFVEAKKFCDDKDDFLKQVIACRLHDGSRDRRALWIVLLERCTVQLIARLLVALTLCRGVKDEIMLGLYLEE